MPNRSLYIGTAGSSIASRYADAFDATGTHLQRYARRMNCAEINTSFYRPHSKETYRRWAGSVPDGFRFSVKIPKSITHERRLADCSDLLCVFMDQVSGLGEHLGILLVQLPPGLPFQRETVERFFDALRDITDVSVACEPRHASWFAPEVYELLDNRWRVSRVVADPLRIEDADRPAGWKHLAYFRMHGSPRVYYSDYDTASLRVLRDRLIAAATEAEEVWCIFDNTAGSHALGNAIELATLMQEADA